MDGAGDSLSNTALYPGSKSENGLYLAFGYTISLALIRWQSSDLYQDPLTAAGFALIYGSILGSVLFYLKPDRIATRALKWAITRKYGEQMEEFILLGRLSLETWRTKSVDVWQDPDDAARKSIARVVDSSDAQDDIWALKGYFFFILAVPLILYAANLAVDEIIIWSLTTLAITSLAGWFHYRTLFSRLSDIAGFRWLQDTYSVMRARDPGSRPTQNWFILGVEPDDDPPIEKVLDELSAILERHDWKGFSNRFSYLRKDFKKWFLHVVSELPYLFIAEWESVLKLESVVKRKTPIERLCYFQNLLISLESSDFKDELLTILPIGNRFQKIYGIEESEYENVMRFFEIMDHISDYNVIHGPAKMVFSSHVEDIPNPDVVMTVANWASKGRREYDELLVEAAENSDSSLRDTIVDILLHHSDSSVWARAGKRVAVSVMDATNGVRHEVIRNLVKSSSAPAVIETISRIASDQILASKDILNLIVHPDNGVTAALIERLRTIEYDLVESAIKQMVNDDNPRTQVNGVLVGVALATVDGEQGEEDHLRRKMRHLTKEFLNHYSENVKCAYMEEGHNAGLVDESALQQYAYTRGRGRLQQTARRILNLKNRKK